MTVGGNYQVTHILELDDGAEIMVDATWLYTMDSWDEQGGWTLEDITSERDLSDPGFAKRVWRTVFEQGPTVDATLIDYQDYDDDDFGQGEL